MNREEAQFILGAYRANSEDAHDPQFQEALALARQDPGLGRWFAAQQALDRALAAKLRSRPIPANLKTQLLLARTTAAGKTTGRWPVWFAAAAAITLLFTAGLSLFPRRGGQDADFAGYRTAMVQTSLDLSNHAEVWGLDAGGYKSWLAEHRGDPDFVLPAKLAEKGISACKVVTWRERKVTMLCFKFSGQHVDVFVVNATDLRDAVGDSPAYFADNGVTTAAWRRDGKVYLLAGAMPQSALEQLQLL